MQEDQPKDMSHKKSASTQPAFFLVGVLFATTMACPFSNAIGPPGGADDRFHSLLARLENPRGDVMVVAHRACWTDGAPENSLAAINECVEMGVDMVEIDVALTRDKVPVLMHDESLERTTGVAGDLSDFDWAELRALRLLDGAGGHSAARSGQTVPSLKAALQLARGRILVNLDVKGSSFDQVQEVVMALGVDDQILMKMAAAPDSPVLADAPFIGKTLFMPIIRECTEQNVDNNCTSRLSAYVPRYAQYHPVAYEITYGSEEFLVEGADTIRAMGSRIWINTLSPHHAAGAIDQNAIEDPSGIWGRVISLGGNIIQTDYPRLLIDYLQSEKRRAE